MTADKTSAYADSLQNVRWCFSRRATILVAVCCVAFLAYSLNCFRGRREAPQVLKSSSDASIQTASVVKVKENTTGLGTAETLADDMRAQDHDGMKEATAARVLQPVYPTLTQDEVDVFSSSSDEEAEETADDSVVESVPLKPQGRWQRRLPQAIIIGVKKGGTRALLEFLRMNLQVAVSGTEVHFFDRHYDRGTDWYRKVMPYSYENQLTMEKTPGYFVTPQVPKRIHHMSPDMKFLVVVREPVARAISDHAQSLDKGKTTPFEDKAMLSSGKCRVDDGWSAIRIGLYAEHLANWLQYFSIGQFFFVSGENLVANPGEEMEKVQDFLRIRRTVTEKSFFFNETKGFPCLRANHKGEAKCLGKTKGRAHNPVDAHVQQCLADFYRPYNQRFYKMTGINFHWEDQGT